MAAVSIRLFPTPFSYTPKIFFFYSFASCRFHFVGGVFVNIFVLEKKTPQRHNEKKELVWKISNMMGIEEKGFENEKKYGS